MKPLLHHEIRGNWATVQLPINPDDSIDLARLADAVERIFAFGVDGLYTNGTAGEFHTQREAEFDAVHDCVAQRCERANTPFQIGVSHMSAQISLDRLKRSVQYAPSAFQVILPDWVVPREDEAVDFLNRMAEAAEGIGLVLYNPPHAKRQLSPIELGRLKQRVPRLVGVKVAGGEADWYHGMREHMQGLSVFVPGHHLANGIREGAHGSYSNVCCIHPGAAQAWYDSMSESMEHAMDVERRLCAFMEHHIMPFARQGFCNAALDKLLAAIGGWAEIGTRLRWPYRFIDPEHAERLRGTFCQQVPEFGRLIRWDHTQPPHSDPHHAKRPRPS